MKFEKRNRKKYIKDKQVYKKNKPKRRPNKEIKQEIKTEESPP